MDKNIILGIDQGFSSIKVSSPAGEFKFANTVREVEQSGNLFSLGTSNSITYEYNGKKYIVGDEASGKSDYYRDVKYLINYAPLMVAAVLNKLKTHGITKKYIAALSIGLPLENIGFMKDYKDKLRSFEVNGEKYNFDTIFGYAQGVGVYADYVYNWGKNIISPSEKGFIWDIGENTMILVSYEGYAVKKDGSRQFDKQGISAIYDIIREPVRKLIEREPSITDLRSALANKKIKSFGQELDCQDIVIPAIKKYLETTYMSIMDKYKEQFSGCDKVILAGGGSYILSMYIEQVFNKHEFFITTPNAEYSNARGYRAIGTAKLNKK